MMMMDHVSRKVDLQPSRSAHLYGHRLGAYVDGVTYSVDKEEKYPIALSAMDQEASKLGPHYLGRKRRLIILALGRPTPSPVIVNGNRVYPAQEFTIGQHPIEQQ